MYNFLLSIDKIIIIYCTVSNPVFISNYYLNAVMYCINCIHDNNGFMICTLLCTISILSVTMVASQMSTNLHHFDHNPNLKRDSITLFNHNKRDFGHIFTGTLGAPNFLR